MAPDQVLPHKARLETSYAFSRTFNPRNLEYHWYSLWCQILFDLVADVPNLIVAPQFPVWTVKPYELEGPDDGDDPEEVEDIEEFARTAHGNQDAAGEVQVSANDDESEEEGDDDSEFAEGDVSFASTVPEKNAKGVLVDFAILALTAVPQSEGELRYGGWRITAANTCLFVELKRFVNRSLVDDKLDAQILLKIREARHDLMIQAGYLFIQDETKNSVMAIAAAGPFWCGATIHRANLKRTMTRLLSNNDPSYQPPGEKLVDRLPKWNEILRLDGPLSAAVSEKRLRSICKTMREEGKTVAR